MSGEPDGLGGAAEQAIATVLERTTRWVDQGCPTRGPVVVQQGLLAVRKSDGHRFMTDWHWDCLFFEGPALTMDELWAFLAERYPVVVAPE